MYNSLFSISLPIQKNRLCSLSVKQSITAGAAEDDQKPENGRKRKKTNGAIATQCIFFVC